MSPICYQSSWVTQLMPHASDLWSCMSAHLEDLADFLSPMEET